ncbi:MAG: ABC transporter ATP-binding protein/permease [Spirochaetaceae bacterium]|jgi:ATP-binding cassette subfamily B protein|nr:ABC transporter ATP-binding protein/permease [Spirochaetaceae bacterium]
MADYFETEAVLKDYDHRIARRILSYVKPYPRLAAAAAAALALSTLGELAVPVMTQKIIDRAILPRFLVEDAAEQGPREQSAAGIRVGSRRFVLQSGAGPQAPRGQEAGGWYAFTCAPSSPAAAAARSHPEMFIIEQDRAAVRLKDLAGLSVREIAAVRAGDLALIIKGALALLGIQGLIFAFTFIQTWTTSLIGQRVMKDIRTGLFKKTVSQSSAFLSRHPVGRLVTRLTGDVETIDEFFTAVLMALLKDLSVMAGVLITLCILSPVLALAAALTLPPVLIAAAVSRVRARDAFRRQRAASSSVNAYLSERLSGAQVVQLFRGEQRSRREFEQRSGELLQAKLGEMYVFATFRPLVEWFSVITVAAVIIAGSYLALTLHISLGVLIAFINLTGMFYAPVMDIAEKYTILQSAMAGGERVFALMDADEAVPDRGVRELAVQGEAAFQDVRFSYKAGEEILKGLSFTAERGAMTAIVGHTGAGKTTIINVLTRLWDIDSGAVLLDGVPVTDIPLPLLRRSALPVLQEVFLFSGTVADNISLGLSLSDAEIEAAAKAVYAHEFIAALPQGYKTALSEGAANISSGQRQLISFARVIAHNPAVVILDEATSSVDTETEALIQLGIKRVLAGRTSIVIAHRLSTIRGANRILVLRDGVVAEQGTHEELLARNGLYAALLKEPPLG